MEVKLKFDPGKIGRVNKINKRKTKIKHVEKDECSALGRFLQRNQI